MLLSKKLIFSKKKEEIGPGDFLSDNSCILAIDKFSLIDNGLKLQNIVNKSIVFNLQEKTEVDSSGGIIFSGSNAAGGNVKVSFNAYTVLCYLDADLDKAECDIIGSGSTSGGDLLLMFYQGVLRGHQWPSGGGAFILDSSIRGGKYVGQSYNGNANPKEFYIINNGDIEKEGTSGGINSSSVKPYFCIGGRDINYHGRFKGVIYGIRVFTKVLSSREIEKEFKNMTDRANA